MFESRKLDSYSETWLSNFVNSTTFMDLIIGKIVIEKSFIALITQFVKITVRDRFQVATVLDPFQQGVRALHGV